MRRTLALLAALAISTGATAQDKPLIAGFDGTFAPHAMPKLGGGVEGFNIDLILEAGKRMGRKIEIFAGEFSGLIPAMQAGKISFVGAPTTVTPERAKTLLFTEGYLNTYYAFVIPAGKPDIPSLEALKGKTIASNKGSAYDKWLQENAAKYGWKAESYGTNADAMQAVSSGRADAGLTGNTVGAYAVLRSSKQLALSKLRVDQGLVWGAAFRKEDVALRNAVEEAFECMKLDGTIAKLHEKWFGLQPEPGSAAVTVYPGYGVPGMEGHDATPHTPKCK
ncbi:MAG TPA: transporter substrate-binding domain-containing protein [Burkholderiales bacterium]|jgi:polar amino acid transport system substrate-binding protein|nr:transporter substrate-binding domain-containing protein [Burkholderiales bacterium]